MSETDSDVLIVTQNGPVRGRLRKTFEDIPFFSFHGIPYAKPPIGDFRFKAPKPIDNWTDVFDATNKSNIATQIHMVTFQYDPQSNEDCLQLNVYTKSVAPATLCPVMVWIHGGGFIMGSTDESIYAPDFLLRKDIVLVTISYRLGPFGFLSVDDPKYEIPGNAGLKDQSLGLRWVQANIDRFGGDPNNVTLFGESAGSVSVHYHMLSNYSKGLFHRAIMQSGTALLPIGMLPKRNQAVLLAKHLGWDGEGGLDAMIRILLNADSKSIATKQQLLEDGEACFPVEFMYGPCIESYGDDTTAFIRTPVCEMAPNAWGNSVPLLIGCTSDEGELFAEIVPDSFDDYEHLFCRYSPYEFNISVGSQKSFTNGNRIREFYYNDQKPSRQSKDIYAKLQSDRLFWHGVVTAIRNRLSIASVNAPTYLYRFCFDSQVPAFKKGEFVAGAKIRPGCWHAEDLMYLFRQYNVYGDFDVPINSIEASIISRFVGIWTSFAMNGNPKCPELNEIEWRPVENVEPYKCLQMSAESEFVDLPDWVRIEFWRSLQ